MHDYDSLKDKRVDDDIQRLEEKEYEMISKELLSEVLGNLRIHTDGGLAQEDNLIHYGCIYGNARLVYEHALAA